MVTIDSCAKSSNKVIGRCAFVCSFFLLKILFYCTKNGFLDYFHSFFHNAGN